MNISFIVICMDNFVDFERTFQSINKVKDVLDEIIVIDSSSNNIIEAYLKKHVYSNVLYYHCNPTGIYPAQNLGINYSNKEYVQIINSGDILIDINHKEQIRLLSVDNKDVYIFSQLCSYNNEVIYEYKPNNKSIWPHQSLIYKRSLHESFGLYNTDYKIISDQLFFKLIRQDIDYLIVDKSLTVYDLTGVSSKLSLILIKEKFILDSLFHGYSFALLKSLIFVIFNILSLIFGSRNIIRFKKLIRSLLGYLR